MIISLLIITLAFIWLLYETDYLRIHLPYGTMTADYNGMETETDNIVPDDTEDTDTDYVPYNPGYFNSMPLPELSGEINILCQIE